MWKHFCTQFTSNNITRIISSIRPQILHQLCPILPPQEPWPGGLVLNFKSLLEEMQSDTTALFIMCSLSSEIVNMGNRRKQKHLNDNSLTVSSSSLSCYWKKEAAAKASRKKWPSNTIRHKPQALGSKSPSVVQCTVIWCGGAF